MLQYICLDLWEGLVLVFCRNIFYPFGEGGESVRVEWGGMWSCRGASTKCCAGCNLNCFPPAPPNPAELHVVDGHTTTGFVKSHYTVEVSATSSLVYRNGGRLHYQHGEWQAKDHWLLAFGTCFTLFQKVSSCRSYPIGLVLNLLLSLSHTYTHPRSVWFHPSQTSDAERIGVDQVAKISASGRASGSEQRECLIRTCVLGGQFSWGLAPTHPCILPCCKEMAESSVSAVLLVERELASMDCWH